MHKRDKSLFTPKDQTLAYLEFCEWFEMRTFASCIILFIYNIQIIKQYHIKYIC